MRPNPQEAEDLVTFTEKLLNEKFDFLCSDNWSRKKRDGSRFWCISELMAHLEDELCF